MKNRIGILALSLVLALTLTSCGGKLSGTYISQGFISQTFIFDCDQVTMSAFGVNATGTYKIENDQITITYILFGSEYTWTQSFSKSGKTINIGGTDFTKQG